MTGHRVNDPAGESGCRRVDRRTLEAAFEDRHRGALPEVRFE